MGGKKRIVRFSVLFVVLTIAVLAADGVTKRIRFARGKNSATVSGSVIRGDRDTYILGARADQMMTVRISSLEDNAVFQIKSPDGSYLQDAGEEDDARSVAISLPATGDYRIIVGGTRGNATYKLSVLIR